LDGGDLATGPGGSHPARKSASNTSPARCPAEDQAEGQVSWTCEREATMGAWS
jgi:hypothetical protein